MSNLNVKIINLKVKLILHLSHCVIAGVQGSPFKKRLEHRGLEDLDNLKFSSSLHLEPLNYYHCQGRGRTVQRNSCTGPSAFTSLMQATSMTATRQVSPWKWLYRSDQGIRKLRILQV